MFWKTEHLLIATVSSGVCLDEHDVLGHANTPNELPKL